MFELVEKGYYLIILISMIVGLEVWGIYKLKHYQKLKKEMPPEKYDNYTNNIDLEKNFKIGVIAYPIIVVLIVFGLYVVPNISDPSISDGKGRIAALVFCASLIIMPIAIFTILFIKKQKEIKGYKNYLLSKYGRTDIKRIFKNQIAQGNINTSGSIRYKYVFSFTVPNYNCIVSQYYYQKLLVMKRDGRIDRSWDTLYTMLEYKYTNIKNFPNFNDENVKYILNELAKSRSLYYETDYDSFIVRKIAASDPTENQIQNNVNDIEIFYTYLLKNINEFNNYQNNIQ